MCTRILRCACCAAALTLGTRALGAQASPPPTPPDTAHKLEAVTVKATRTEQAKVDPLQRFTLPVTASITANQVDQTVNAIDPEDAVKYLPSVLVRKRNYGDTQATLETRVWGVSSSARSLIFADGIPLTALVANNNTVGGPRWGLVAPDEIARVDMMYGPFSAAYAGNSMGGVMEITTRQPDSLELSIGETGAFQRFGLYGTDRTFGTSETDASVADRLSKFSFRVGGTYEDNHSQPLLYVTNGSFPAGTSGGFAASNKLGATADVLGATGLLHTGMANANAKLAYDITPVLRATYTIGYWDNDQVATDATYLQSSANDQPTYAAQPGFATGFYDWREEHTAQSVALRTDGTRDWDLSVVGTNYRFNKDQQRFPVSSSASDTSFGTAGRVALLDGTGWTTADVKAAWHQGGLAATHTLSFGVHADWYALHNPTYNTPDWHSNNFTSVATEGDGKTATEALWAQDAWITSATTKLTLGARYEWSRGYDGFNQNGTTQVTQPEVRYARWSPKASFLWEPVPQWSFAASLGKAYRFATASELYQLVSTGATFTSPDPHLKPDNDLSAELRATRNFDRGTARVSLFQDDVHDAIIAQFLPLVQGSSQLFSAVSNVDHVRARGVEAALDLSQILPRFDLSTSATYVDARTLALSGSASATAPAGSAVGKFLPNIPRWRATAVGTYHASRPLALSLAARYSSKMYTTLDDADVNPDTYQGFAEWFVMDARANYAIDRNWSAAVGVDNLLDRKYFLFHPFPQRTLILSAKYTR